MFVFYSNGQEVTDQEDTAIFDGLKRSSFNIALAKHPGD
jgi:hypothetical protein